MNLRELEVAAKEALPIATVTLINYLNDKKESIIEIRWNFSVMNREMKWEIGWLEMAFPREDDGSFRDNLVEIQFKQLKEAYMSHRDKISHIDDFKWKYRQMLAAVYSDEKTLKRFRSLNEHD